MDKIHDQLVGGEDLALRECIAKASHELARKYLGTESMYQRLRESVLAAPETVEPV